MPGNLGFGTYFKAALTSGWSMLLLVGAFAAGLYYRPQMDIFLPIVAGAELALATVLAAASGFRHSIDLRRAAEDSEKAAEELTRKFNQLFYRLDLQAQGKFNELRTRCESLRDLTIAGRDDATLEESLEKVSATQLLGVNKLLWVYLKLLFTRTTLDKFLKTTDEREINKLEDDARRQLETIPKEASDEISEKKRRSLEDTVKTSQQRRDNLKRARENFEYVELEIKRIGAKLTALSELAVNRQDPRLISTEVDDVTQSIQTTEQTINDLNEFTGFTTEDQDAPPILNRSSAHRVRS